MRQRLYFSSQTAVFVRLLSYCPPLFVHFAPGGALIVARSETVNRQNAEINAHGFPGKGVHSNRYPFDGGSLIPLIPPWATPIHTLFIYAYTGYKARCGRLFFVRFCPAALKTRS